MSLQNTPASNRLHIGIFGRRNSGKSSLINAITGQNSSLVSDVAGTTTDPVFKAMEIRGIGPCMFIDTAGFDDEGALGEMRVEKTKGALDKTDVAVIVVSQTDLTYEKKWAQELKKRKTPIIAVINKADILDNALVLRDMVREHIGVEPIILSAKTGEGVAKVREELIRSMPEDYEKTSIASHLVDDGDLVLLVMPQDIQAPKGRLILPQVQTIRDLLDAKCMVMCCTCDKLDQTLKALAYPPKLIVTDSQVFKTVYEKKPEQSKLSSFSVLFAAYKGDIAEYVNGAKAIASLNPNSRVLIAEACTHAPQEEDIGRVKLPRMLKKLAGEALTVDIVSGNDFPSDLTPYDLIIQCGACMFNRRYVLSRIELAKEQNVPITNYGVAIAWITGILDEIDY